MQIELIFLPRIIRKLENDLFQKKNTVFIDYRKKKEATFRIFFIKEVQNDFFII